MLNFRGGTCSIFVAACAIKLPQLHGYTVAMHTSYIFMPPFHNFPHCTCLNLSMVLYPLTMTIELPRFSRWFAQGESRCSSVMMKCSCDKWIYHLFFLSNFKTFNQRINDISSISIIKNVEFPLCTLHPTHIFFQPGWYIMIHQGCQTCPCRCPCHAIRIVVGCRVITELSEQQVTQGIGAWWRLQETNGSLEKKKCCRFFFGVTYMVVYMIFVWGLAGKNDVNMMV